MGQNHVFPAELFNLARMFKLLLVCFLAVSVFLSFDTCAQASTYQELKMEFDRLRSEEKQDSALQLARKMNKWALKNEQDTSLRYAVSFRYIGNCFYSMQLTDSAMSNYTISMAVLKKQNRLEHADFAMCLNNIGNLQADLGNYKESEKHHLQAMELRESVLGNRHPDYAASLNNLGILYYNIGDYKSAEIHYLKALRIRESVLPEGHEDIGISLNNLANVYSELGDFKTAEQYYQRTLKLFESKLGNEHPYFASIINNLGNFYVDIGKYADAEPLYNQALAIRKKVLDFQHPDVATTLNNIGSLASKMSRFDIAEKCFNEALSIQKTVFGSKHAVYAMTVHNLGMSYLSKGNYVQADSCFLEALHTRIQTLGPQHPDCGESYSGISDYYAALGDYQKADSILQLSLEIKRKSLGENHPKFAQSLINQGVLYNKMADYKNAELVYEQAMSIQKIALGEFHPSYATALSNLGVLRLNMGDYESAERHYQQALEIRLKCYGREHPEVALSLNNMGNLARKKGDYNTAQQLLTEAAQIRNKTLGENHLDYAASLNNMGVLYYDLGNFKLSKSNYKKALEIRESILSDAHMDVGISLNNLGNVCSEMGDFKSAEIYYNRTSEVFGKTLGEDHPYFAMSLNNLGALYFETGNYQNAEKTFNRSLDITRKTLSYDHIDCANSLNNLGSLYSKMGDYFSADLYFNDAINIIKKAIGEENTDYANSLNNLGLFYTEKEDVEMAEQCLNKALSIHRKVSGNEHPDCAQSYLSLSELFSHIGNRKAADTCLSKALTILEKTFGDDHPEVARCLTKIAINKASTKDYIGAESFFKRAIEICRMAFGEGHMHVAEIENQYAYVLIQTNKIQEAYAILFRNYQKMSKDIADNFEWLNDNQREAYWKKEAVFFDKLSWLTHVGHSSLAEVVKLDYNAALLSKSKLLEVKISSENYYRELEEIREELAYRRRLSAKMESDGNSDRNRLMQLRREADSLDKRLTVSWPEYAQQKKNLSITWNQVQQNLEPGEAAIEFVRFLNESDSLVYYNALLLRKGDSQPRLVRLCNEKQLEKTQPKLGFSAYYPLVWQPMEELLKDIKTIYYSPVGILNTIPFPALYPPKNEGDLIVEAKTDKRGVVTDPAHAKVEEDASFLMDKYVLHQLTSTRYLAIGLKDKVKQPIDKQIGMVGGVNYDYLPGVSVDTKNGKKEKGLDRSSASASGSLAYLPGTKQEIDLIAETVTKSGWTTIAIAGDDAKEEKITALEGKDAKSVLHLATHGYAFSEYNSKDTSVNKKSLRYSYRYAANPMVRSGLILTGGNWAWTGSDTMNKLGAPQNGILTALEVSQLNLKKTKLVVLSACETGLGAIDGSEGTFGLKRAFKLAGVDQLIVSQWSVPDKETMELMTLFYDEMSKSLNPVTSFEKAQRDMRKKYPQEPDKWAGFVLVR